MAYPVPFAYTVPKPCYSSALVYDGDGVMVYKLWDTQREDSAGVKTGEWTGINDENHLSENGGYHVKMQYSNVEDPDWSAGILNSSIDPFGPNRHGAYGFYNSISASPSGDFIYACTGFNEGRPSFNKVDVNDIQRRKFIYDVSGRQQYGIFSDNDGVTAYQAGYDGNDPKKDTVSFIIGVNMADDARVVFGSGVSLKINAGGITYASVVGLKSSGTDLNNPIRISGFGVSRNYNYMYASYSLSNEIQVLDKRQSSGALLFTITDKINPSKISIRGNDLWLRHTVDNIWEKFLINSDGTLSTTAIVLTGYIEGLDIAINEANTELALADRNNDFNIVRFYNPSNGVIRAYSIGGNESYYEDPNVLDNKFNWGRSALCFVGSRLWVTDSGNCRIQIFNSDRTFYDAISWLDARYSISVPDGSDPTNIRMLSEYLEVKVDMPKIGQAGWWKLTRNYNRMIPSAYAGSQYNVFNEAVILPNGRLYATLRTFTSKEKAYFYLPETGVLRKTHIVGEYSLRASDAALLTYYRPSSTGNRSVRYTEKLSSGVNEFGDPVHVSTETDLFLIPKSVSTDPAQLGLLNLGSPQGLKVTSDKYVTFEAKNEKNGFHVGIVQDNKFIAKTAKPTPTGYNGFFPKDGYFDQRSGGGKLIVVDGKIIWNYPGEGYNGGQTNYYNVVSEYGHHITRFGVANGIATYDVSGRSPAKMAGNVKNIGGIKYNNKWYVFSNDESQQAAVHMWTVDLNDISYQDIDITLNVTDQGALRRNYTGKVFDNINNTSNTLISSLSVSGLDINGSVIIQGYFKPLYTELYTFKLTADSTSRLIIKPNMLPVFTTIINNEVNVPLSMLSGTIQLTAELWYLFRIELTGSQGSLLWSSPSQVEQEIPASLLRPTVIPDYSNGVSLLENFESETVIGNKYGWVSNTGGLTSGLKVQTVQYEYNRNELYVYFRQNSPATTTIDRNVGTDAVEKLLTWDIFDNVNYFKNYPNRASNGQKYQILDSNGLIIGELNTLLAGNGVQLLFNGRVLRDASQLTEILLSQPLTIHYNGATLDVFYGPYGWFYGIPILNPSAVATKPKTLRLFFKTANKGEDRIISLADTVVRKVLDTFVPDPPVSITSISPVSAKISDSVVITGINLTDVTEVTFGGIPAKSFVVNSSTSITAIVAVGNSGNVYVNGVDGSFSFPGFTFIAPSVATDLFLIGYKVDTE